MTGERPPEPALLAEGRRLVRGAAERNATLRLLGALGIEYRCLGAWRIAVRAGRTTADVDLMGLRREWGTIVSTFETLGYEVDERRAMLHGQDRLVFFHPAGFRVDVFLDRLNMCHVLDLRARLGIHDTTLSLADLLLQKLQIVELTAKDVIDILVLLREHPIGEDESVINAAYVARLLAGDWGFHHTATRNLLHVRGVSLAESEALEDGDREVVRQRIDELVARIDDEPKSLGWRTRARIGTRIRWYREVDEFQR